MGYFRSPLDYPPHEHSSGRGRYDDPRREFRTLYCAPDPLTCLRERLAGFRYSKKMSEDRRKQGKPSSKKVTLAWRTENALASGSLDLLKGELVPVYEPSTFSMLEEELSELLSELRISRLDAGHVMGRQRRLTRAIARAIFDQGGAGILYFSRRDHRLCCALFEGRARLVPIGTPKLLSEPLPEFDQVCEEFELDVEVAIPRPLA